MKLYLGIDVGTSGVRTAVIDGEGTEISSASIGMPLPEMLDNRPCQDPQIWWDAVSNCLSQQAATLANQGRSLQDVVAVSVDGTSGTMLLTDADLQPLTTGYMYNSADFDEEAAMIDQHASPGTIARGAGSGLARLMFLQTRTTTASHALHQADWIAAKLMQKGGISDETNALKTGYDPHQRCWPDWIERCGVNLRLLPEVKVVGQSMGSISDSVCQKFGFSKAVDVRAGVTDSNAAFLASGATQVGDGVTSLGSTLAIKLLSNQPVTDPSRGIYSHRIKDMWLSGGASNTGGAVLKHFFSDEQLHQLQPRLDPNTTTNLDYYPLVRPGERFPFADSELPPRLTPRPNDDAVFFQAILEGIAEIERIGYAALEELGAGEVQRVFAAGGGAANDAWTQIRHQKLNRRILQAQSSQAAVGTARIAAGLV